MNILSFYMYISHIKYITYICMYLFKYEQTIILISTYYYLGWIYLITVHTWECNWYYINKLIFLSFKVKIYIRISDTSLKWYK